MNQLCLTLLAIGMLELHGPVSRYEDILLDVAGLRISAFL